MDKQVYLPIMTGLLFGAFGALVFSPSAYSVWGFALATFAWGLAMGSSVKSTDPSDEWERIVIRLDGIGTVLNKHSDGLMEQQKQLESVRTAINMKQLGR